MNDVTGGWKRLLALVAGVAAITVLAALGRLSADVEVTIAGLVGAYIGANTYSASAQLRASATPSPGASYTGPAPGR